MILHISYLKNQALKNKMKKLSSEEIRRNQIAILDAFVEICAANNLRYYLCGGTLLGAIRHKGFIPWDDDIDVFMPRPDFEKIQKLLFPKPYEMQFYKNGKSCKPFIKISNTSIVAREKNNIKEAFLWIDVFAFDSLFENNFLNKWHYKIVRFLRKGIYFGFRPKTGFFGGILLFFFKLFGISPEKVNTLFSAIIDRISKIRKYEKGPYIGGINWGYGPQERMLREDLEQSCEMLFEGKCYNVPVGYDKYLRNLYKDYMTLPPEEKRKNHGLEAWDISEGHESNLV